MNAAKHAALALPSPVQLAERFFPGVSDDTSAMRASLVNLLITFGGLTPFAANYRRCKSIDADGLVELREHVRSVIALDSL